MITGCSGNLPFLRILHRRVRVYVKEDNNDIDLVFSTPACPPGDGGDRRLRNSERSLVELWNQLGLGQGTVESELIVGFLRRISRRLWG